MKYDHVLLIGYGGPRSPEEVLPFLRAMAGGKSIADERLQVSARRYEAIGGASPYHDEVMRFAEKLSRSLSASDVPLPVFVAMKNWEPFLREVLMEIKQKGHHKGLVIILNAFPGAVAGARYKESLKAAQVSGLEYAFVDDWHSHGLFIDAQADEVRKSLASIPEKERVVAPVVFTFHSLPIVTGQENYDREARETSAFVAARADCLTWSVAYQSKPASAGGAWLGPDICEVLGVMGKTGEKRAVVVPLGFLCDHVEVLYDLDHEAAECAQASGIEFLRVGTVLRHPKILQLFQELIKRELES